MKLPWWKNMLSWLMPVRAAEASTPLNPVLALNRYRGGWELCTADAVYSDTKAYRPLQASFAFLGKKLPAMHTMLMLGGGLGSAAHLLDKMNLYPKLTLIEKDGQIAFWAEELMPAASRDTTEIICGDAVAYIRKNTASYHLLVCDLFTGRNPLPILQDAAFLQHCRNALLPGGTFILNYISTDKEAALALERLLGKAFSVEKQIAFGLNTV